MAKVKKYYWLKLKKDFFKRHDIRVIEDMPNGKDYILFYLKLLVESLAHEGRLRFSDTIPYDEKMLASVTNTNIDIVRSAMKVFSQLELVDLLDDETIFMNELEEMIGAETEWAKKKRIYREKQKELALPNEDNERTSEGQKRTLSDKSIEIRDKSIENRYIDNTNTLYITNISLILQGGKEFVVNEKMILEFQNAYPSVEVMEELKKMRMWTLSNPSKRKTKSGAMRFINNWLNRASDDVKDNTGRKNGEFKYADGSMYPDER